MTPNQTIFDNAISIEKLEERLEMESASFWGSIAPSCVSSPDEF